VALHVLGHPYRVTKVVSSTLHVGATLR
jgi:hypothetical protein